MLAPKMVNSARFCHLTRYLIAVLALVYFVFPHLRNYSRTYAPLRSFQQEDDKQLYLAAFIENEVGGDLDGSALAKLCASKTWFSENQAIVLSCDPVAGGLGTVKNGQLNCIRFAIEIGGRCPVFHETHP